MNKNIKIKRRNIENDGISLIALMVTMLVVVILAAVMIPKGIDKINSARLAAFNENILTLRDEIVSYIALNNQEYPVKTDALGNKIIYSIQNDRGLLAEITKKGDQDNTFYIVDLKKLKVDNLDNGNGKSIDDYYIVAKTSLNVYYAKGEKIDDIVCYTKRNDGDGVIAIVPTSAQVQSTATPTIGVSTPTLTPTPTPTPAQNPPVLAAGMTPIKLSGSSWIAANSTNAGNDWYDYTNGVNRWANVKLADDSMFVWIPRFTYKILTNEHSATAGSMDIKFSNGTIDDTSNSYRVHPAFYWGGWDIQPGVDMVKVGGGSELRGIWVAKFEPSYPLSMIKIEPGVFSIGNMYVKDIFTNCRQMQTSYSSTYGISTDTNIIDTHMMKNSEWGAVAYLSKWALGSTAVTQNTANNSSVGITGGGNGTAYLTNTSQSCTGNAYGIYDMSGAENEYMAAYINNGRATLTTNGGTLMSASGQYKDIYPKPTTESQTNNYSALSKVYGHAIYETSNSYIGNTSWFNAVSYMPATTSPFLVRGGNYMMSNTGIFYFDDDDGVTNDSLGFRVTIMAK